MLLSMNWQYSLSNSRFSNLLDLPEGEDMGKAINAAMNAIEDENSYQFKKRTRQIEEDAGMQPRRGRCSKNYLPPTPFKLVSELAGVLPKTYNRIDDALLVELLKKFSEIDLEANDLEGDAFGKIYEYFLGKFAMSEGQMGGESFTPPSVVKLIVEIIEPFHGRTYDPACGSGGMFVQSAKFVA